MSTDKQMMLAFQEQFNTGRLFTETQVLVLMGYARGEARRELISSLPAQKEKITLTCPYMDIKCPQTDLSGTDKLIECKDCDFYPCFNCFDESKENCNKCTIIKKG